MMNYIWGGMLLIGIAFAAYRGVLGAFSEGLMNSCTEGVFFVIGLTGIMAVWSGLMNIAKDSGLIDSFAQQGNHCDYADEFQRKYFRSRQQCNGLRHTEHGNAGRGKRTQPHCQRHNVHVYGRKYVHDSDRAGDHH